MKQLIFASADLLFLAVPAFSATDEQAHGGAAVSSSAASSYYGKPAGDKLTALLKEHITIAVDIIKFAKAGDNPVQGESELAARHARRDDEQAPGNNDR